MGIGTGRGRAGGNFSARQAGQVDVLDALRYE